MQFVDVAWRAAAAVCKGLLLQVLFSFGQKKNMSELLEFVRKKNAKMVLRQKKIRLYNKETNMRI